MRPKALQGKRSPALCFQYLFSIAPGTEVFWKHEGTDTCISGINEAERESAGSQVLGCPTWSLWHIQQPANQGLGRERAEHSMVPAWLGSILQYVLQALSNAYMHCCEYNANLFKSFTDSSCHSLFLNKWILKTQLVLEPSLKYF